MWSTCTALVFALVAASSFTSVYVLEFCQNISPECHSDDNTASNSQSSLHTVKSKWTLNASSLMHDLNQFRVSCKKLLEALPIDKVDGNFVRTVKNCIFSKSIPTPLKGPLRLAAASKFGYWAGQLGDGRAHFLGQYSNKKGEVWELQLKGSGKTPYSRSGDGRAVIRSSVREFLCSEAMHFLGVPTSRAASLIVSEEPVLRDQFYNGNVKAERGAVVLRLAKSWFRIGSLEILSQSGEIDLLRKLLNFVIDEHFPFINPDNPEKYLVFFSTVVNETADLIAQWMSVGFAHAVAVFTTGVCNTDNFSILSITIDYGPFGFMESYNPNFIPNTSDDEGRYSIGAQANIGLFNLEKLLVALIPVLTQTQQKQAKIILKGYANIYQMRVHQIFKAKLGLLGEDEDDNDLIAFLLKMMEDTESDFTMTFRELSEVSANQLLNRNFTQMWALDDLSHHKHFSDWLNKYLFRLSRQQDDSHLDRQHRMKNVNPRYVLRNWMAESAIRKAERNDFSEVELLHHILSSPFVTQETAEEAGYAARPPQWARRLKVSCSS
ncbi:unnamed protein product [Oreochromis niloticus]|nr:unnamed protein product [Mustela putorius furo]